MRSFVFFFFNDTATTEIYTLSLHDALPISGEPRLIAIGGRLAEGNSPPQPCRSGKRSEGRSEEHTSELQSHSDLVCRLLLEKKKKKEKSRTKPGDKESIASTRKIVDSEEGR